MVQIKIITNAFVLGLLLLASIPICATASSLPKATWFPAGLDVIRDPLSGQLAVPEFYGATMISGSANTPAIWQDPVTKDALLYIGASNGGVYLRRYSYSNNRWSDRWSWVSRPGSGYVGSQSIAALSISPNGRYLAVGQGNPTNYAHIGVPGNGVQLGEIQGDGSIRWLANSADADKTLTLSGIYIRSLDWQGGGLLATVFIGGDKSFGYFLAMSQSDSGGIGKANILRSAIADNYMTARFLGWSSERPLLIAGHAKEPPAGVYANAVGLYANVSGTPVLAPLLGSLYADYLVELQNKNLRIGRISVYPRFINGAIIAFVGSWVNGKLNPIGQIDRLVIDPVTFELLDYESAAVTNKIGSNQAENDNYYGNFSLSADPLDPQGLRVFAGGNTYGGINAYTYAGGLVAVGFGNNPSSLDYLYGPIGSFGVAGDRAPGAPHADSRQITYYDTPNGVGLIQSDDGGVWQLPLEAKGIRWWSSLSAPGLNTLENTRVDWNAATNSLVAAYQDNAASIGRFTSPYPYMQNVTGGDGSLAFFDDAIPTDVGHFTSAYVSPQEYLKSGNIQRVAIDPYGFFKSYDSIDMYVDIDGRRLPLNEGDLFKAQDLTVPFGAPVSATPGAYRTGDIVLAGTFNVYETIAVDRPSLPDSLVFNTLFDWNVDPTEVPQNLNTYWVNSIDNQGSALYKHLPFDSLYIGLQLAGPSGKNVTFSGIYGRQAGSSQNIEPIYSSDPEAGTIIAITHRPNPNQKDTVYWLQGGSPIVDFNTTLAKVTPKQVLGIHLPNGQNRTLALEELGIEFNPLNLYKAQSLVYVPAVNGHGEYLVIASQEGAWIASLNASGLPESFSLMNWQGLPSATPPGSYNTTLKYDPQDDVLVSAMLGQGIWLYSFSGQLEPPKVSDQALILTDTVLRLQAKSDLDRRGNQFNTGIFVQLNDQQMDPNKSYDVELVFHEFSQWQNNLELLIPQASTVGKTPASFNLLDSSGQARFNATLKNGELTLPVHFEPGVTKMVVTVNAKEFPEFVPTFSLNFSASLRNGAGQATGHLVFDSGNPSLSVYIPGGRSLLDPYSPEFNPQDGSLLRFRFTSDKWVAGPIQHIQGQDYSDNDVVYVGTQGNKIKSGKGADLLYIDGNTTGNNQLYGGPGKNQFRLVSTPGHIPSQAQWIMDFKPGLDTIGLVGVTYEDLSFKNSPQGAELYVFGEKVGVFRNIGKVTLKRKKNFSFFP